MNSMRDTVTDAITCEIADLITLYDFSESASVKLLAESENKIYFVSDPERTDKYVVRVNSGRLSYHAPPVIASELLWLKALRRDTNIVVPDVLPARDGSLVQTINAPGLDKPRHAVIYSFLSGTEPPENQLVSGFQRLGEISAHMHLHARDWKPPAEFDRPSWLPQEIFNDRMNWGPWQKGVGIKGETLSLLENLEGVVLKRVSTLPKDRENFGLIHADLRLANILVDDDHTAIIDFDDCGYGWYLFDLASALSFLEERSDVPDLIASWLKGYRKVKTLSGDIEAEISTLIMMRRLQLVGWVGYQQQHLEFARQIGTTFTIDTCRLAADYLRRFA